MTTSPDWLLKAYDITINDIARFKDRQFEATKWGALANLAFAVPIALRAQQIEWGLCWD